MNKKEAIEFMINAVEKIEKEKMAEHMSANTDLKKDCVAAILKTINNLEINDEN